MTKSHDGAVWCIRNLTARDLFAIHAALEVATDDTDQNGDEYFPGLNDALEKVMPLIEGLRTMGQRVHPETSIQSQSFIDGAAPWFAERMGDEHGTAEEHHNDGRLRCVMCGYDLGDAEDGSRDPSCPRCLARQDEDEFGVDDERHSCTVDDEEG